MARDLQAALVALNRFGFGARGGASGDFVNAASDPRGFVKAELAPPQRRAARSARPAVDAGARQGGVRLSVRDPAGARRRVETGAGRRDRGAAATTPDAKGSGETCRSTASRWTSRRRSRRRKPPENANASMADPSAASAETMQPNAPKPPPQPLNIIQKTFRAEALARLQRGIIADCGFTERLVVFWSNHFCISAGKGGLARMWAGSFEREAIRPHVLGRFGDMLKAVEQHPAMLFFLDNQQSLGPDSRAGPEPQPRPERKPRPRDHGAAYARRRRRLFAGRRHLAGAHHHGLDLCGAAGPARRARHLRVQRQCAPAGRAGA